MTHATFMRASRAYNKAIEQSNVDKARRSLVRLVSVSARHYKGNPPEGIHMREMLSSVKKFNHSHMRKVRASMIKDGLIDDVPSHNWR